MFYLVKFTKERFKASAVEGSTIRVGSLLLYQEIEDERFRDPDEGLGKVSYESSLPLDAETFNRIFEHDGFWLEEGWEIDTGSVPLLGKSREFNCYVFCCSILSNLDNVDVLLERFGADSIYFVDRPWQFADGVARALKERATSFFRDRPDLLDHEFSIQDLLVLPVLNRVRYQRLN